MSQDAKDLIQSRADASATQRTLSELAARLIAEGVRDERRGC